MQQMTITHAGDGVMTCVVFDNKNGVYFHVEDPLRQVIHGVVQVNVPCAELALRWTALKERPMVLAPCSSVEGGTHNNTLTDMKGDKTDLHSIMRLESLKVGNNNEAPKKNGVYMHDPSSDVYLLTNIDDIDNGWLLLSTDRRVHEADDVGNDERSATETRRVVHGPDANMAYLGQLFDEDGVDVPSVFLTPTFASMVEAQWKHATRRMLEQKRRHADAVENVVKTLTEAEETRHQEKKKDGKIATPTSPRKGGGGGGGTKRGAAHASTTTTTTTSTPRGQTSSAAKKHKTGGGGAGAGAGAGATAIADAFKATNDARVTEGLTMREALEDETVYKQLLDHVKRQVGTSIKKQVTDRIEIMRRSSTEPFNVRCTVARQTFLNNNNNNNRQQDAEEEVVVVYKDANTNRCWGHEDMVRRLVHQVIQESVVPDTPSSSKHTASSSSE